MDAAAKISFNKTRLGPDFYLSNSQVQHVYVSIIAANADAASFSGNFHSPQGKFSWCRVLPTKLGGCSKLKDSSF